MRLIFAGTPVFARIALKALLGTEHTLVAVYTQPDRRSGRGQKLRMSSVKQLALQHGIEVQQPKTLKDSKVQAQIQMYHADLMIVAAYGLILPEEVLLLQKYGCINIHASLLPRWRGAAPIQRAIEYGDLKTGITIIQMDAGLDTGAILLKHDLRIEAQDNSATLHDKLAALGSNCIVTALKDFFILTPLKQNDCEATYAKKITKPEGVIDWRLPAFIIERQIRAFNPSPVAYTYLGETRIRIFSASVCTNVTHAENPGRILNYTVEGLQVACGDGSVLAIQSLQWPGAKVLTASVLYYAKKDHFLRALFFALPH